IRALPPEYQNNVFQVSADEANPNPATWHLMARHRSNRGVPVYFIVSQGRVISERDSYGLGSIFGSPTAIDLSRVQQDSTDVWTIADHYIAGRGRGLGSVSFRLEQEGRAAVPTWSVWCYDLSGRYAGFLTVLATTGAIISSN
ncbi:MAG TPA: hypothetical protein VIS74_06535, partial [Chthoniobacterales bacterium]